MKRGSQWCGVGRRDPRRGSQRDWGLQRPGAGLGLQGVGNGEVVIVAGEVEAPKTEVGHEVSEVTTPGRSGPNSHHRWVAPASGGREERQDPR